MNRQNWGTLYRILMSGKYSEKHVAKVKSQFQAAESDEERAAIFDSYNTGAKKAGQNKAVATADTKVKASKPKRARKEDGTFQPDDPSTPDKNEAFDPPTPTKKGRKLFSRGKKG